MEETLKFAYSIVLLDEMQPRAVQEDLFAIINLLPGLSKDQIRTGKMNTQKKAESQGKDGFQFWKHMESLKAKIPSELPVHFNEMYRIEIFAFSDKRVYSRIEVINPLANKTIRLYQKQLNDDYHYDLLLSKVAL